MPRIPDPQAKFSRIPESNKPKKKFQDFGIQISSRKVIGVYSFNNFTYSDIDECTTSHPVCDVNANCTNTQGSYFCTCKTGFSGDGKTCQGIVGKQKHCIVTGITNFILRFCAISVIIS